MGPVTHWCIADDHFNSDPNPGHVLRNIDWHGSPVTPVVSAMASTLEMLISIGKQINDLPDVYDPLASITEIIRSEPQTRRTYVLTAILHGLASDREAFSESHIYTLGHDVLALVVRLTHDLLNARYSKHDLVSATRCMA